MRIIDADALIRRWCGMKCGCERDECGREIEPCIVVMAIEEAPTIKTKQIKYYDEDENVWKVGEVIVNSSEKPNNSTISKMEQVDKDINVRSKDEPQTNADQHVQHVESVEPMQTEREGE